MKLTAQIKLLTTQEQHDALLQTLQLANAACNYMSERARETHLSDKIGYQKFMATTKTIGSSTKRVKVG